MKFIHTADWHLGYSNSLFNKNQNKLLAESRFSAIKNMFHYAKENRVNLILCAGDQFDNGQVENKEFMLRLYTLFNEFSSIKVIMVTGNHDPFCGNHIYEQVDARLKPGNFFIIKNTEEIHCPEINTVVYAASLTSKNGRSIPLNNINPELKNCIQIGLVHGSAMIEGKYNKDDFPVPLDFCHKNSLDYLALGHWHAYQEINERTYYPGTIMPLHFTDTSGFLHIEIKEKGALPLVKRVTEKPDFSWEFGMIEVNDLNIEEKIRNLGSKFTEKSIIKLEFTGLLNYDNYIYLNDMVSLVKQNSFFSEIENNVKILPGDFELDKISDSVLIKNIIQKINDMEKNSCLNIDLPAELKKDLDTQKILQRCKAIIFDFLHK